MMKTFALSALMLLATFAPQGVLAQGAEQYGSKSAVMTVVTSHIGACNLPALTAGQTTCIEGRVDTILASGACRGSAASDQTCDRGVVEQFRSMMSACVPSMTTDQQSCVMAGGEMVIEDSPSDATQNREDIKTAGATLEKSDDVKGGLPEFVPLTSIPAIQELAGGEGSLPDFFNALYRICIGLAATLAVFQLIRAGAIAMFQQGSVIQKGKVRELVTSSVFGLALVLSPVIVFSAIDPRILDLEIGFGTLRTNLSSPSSNGLNAQERRMVQSVTASAASKCGVPLTDAQLQCTTDAPNSTAAQSCLPELTEQQRECMWNEASRIGDVCTGFYATEMEVISSAQRECCTLAGMNAFPRPGDGDDYICTAREELADDAAGDQAGGQTFKNIPTTVGTFNFVLYDSSADAECTQIVHGSYAEQAACQTALTSERASRPSFDPYRSCSQATATYVQITSAGRAFCPSIITLP